MAKALKLMTWNVRQLPFIGGGTLDPVPFAKKQAEAILALPPRDQPDMITFNEVFIGSARTKLIDMLKGRYPNFIRKFGGSFPLQDSGLMVMSKLPLKIIATGGTSHFQKFKTSDMTDGDEFAEKGVALVQVDGPRGPTVIGITHTQSGSGNAAIRKKQFARIHTAVKAVATTPELRRNTVVVGDINVHGDANATSGEVIDVFTNTANTFGGLFYDGWPATVKPPQDNLIHDPGHTHQKDAAGTNVNRLDYFCLPRASAGNAGLVSHHTWVAIKPPFAVSDHWAMMSVLHGPAPHCSPSSAVNLQALAPALTDPGGAKLWQMAATISDQGMYFWLYIKAPGSYAAFGDAVVEMAIYKQSDLSHAVGAAGAAVATDFPAGFGAALAPFPAGKHWTMAEPFFLRIRGSAETFTGTAQLAIIQQSAAIT